MLRLLIDREVRSGDGAILPLIAAATAARIPVERVPRSRLDAIHDRHQGVAVEVAEFAYAPLDALIGALRRAGDAGLVLVLDELQDPQNVGTLLRTALAVGVTGIVVPERRAAPITSAVVRSSAGAAEHLTIVQVPNLVRALDRLKTVGLWVVGLDLRGKLPYDQADLHGPVAVVVGSEGRGLRRLVRERCDITIHLPMTGPTESLNAAVAGSIALYHISRSHARPPTT